jgi:hypothetical protein
MEDSLGARGTEPSRSSRLAGFEGGSAACDLKESDVWVTADGRVHIWMLPEPRDWVGVCLTSLLEHGDRRALEAVAVELETLEEKLMDDVAEGRLPAGDEPEAVPDGFEIEVDAVVILEGLVDALLDGSD